MNGLTAWLREVEPDRVPTETIAHLRDGVPMEDLWAAGALTAAHFVSNQARNLLGFVSHAMIGCEDARQAAQGQPVEIQELLLIQALHQVAVDLRDPCFAPYELLDVWGIEEATVDDGIAALRRDVQFGEWMRADHRFVGLERTLPRDQLIDLLLDIGLEGIVTDDHTLITPALALDMMDLTGWSAGFPMLRATLRYSCTFPRNLAPYAKACALIEEFDLYEGGPLTGFDHGAARELRHDLLVAAPQDRPRVVAERMRTQSAETIMAALSIAACDMYLQVDPVPHDDFDAVSREVAPIHIGTTLNVLRSCLPRMSAATAVRAVLMGGCLLERGPSVLSPAFEFIPFVPSRPYPYPEDVEALLGRDSNRLLQTLEASLFGHDVRSATAAVKAFELSDGDPEVLITALTRVACMDDGTLMHNVKHLHSCIAEFRACRDADRWNFLVAAAKWISWYAGKDTTTYERSAPYLTTSVEVT